MTTEIRIGDVRVVLPTLGDQSVHCVVTSPPYWGLRDYGVEGQLGLERTPEEYVENMVDVFREVRRVLRDDGTLWLNLGDSYTDSGRGADIGSTLDGTRRNQAESRKTRVRENALTGLRPKNLLGMPWRVAFALQADGWFLRADIIWAKPNPMPESVRDRPTRAHEYVFLLSKSSRYYYDADAIRTPARERAEKMPDGWATHAGAHGSIHREGREKGRRSDKQRGHGRRHVGFNDRWDAMPRAAQMEKGANARTVWTIAPHPFKGAHFATFPPRLARPCILAGSPLGGTVLDPFGGAGTTGLVAKALGRHSLLIELNAEYAAMARGRIGDDAQIDVLRDGAA